MDEKDELEKIWSVIPKEDRERIDRLLEQYRPAPVVLAYDNDDDGADEDVEGRLDHYDMPPMSDEDAEVLFADLRILENSARQ